MVEGLGDSLGPVVATSRGKVWVDSVEECFHGRGGRHCCGDYLHREKLSDSEIHSLEEEESLGGMIRREVREPGKQ